MSIKVATILAQGLLEEMKKGTIPWERNYTSKGLPYNCSTNKDYHGFNAFILMVKGSIHGDNRFLGLKQAAKISGKLKDGEFKKGTPIYCPIFKNFEKDGKKEQKLVNFRFSTVYSVTQFTGLN